VLPPDNRSTTLKQCWFVGDHSSIGGGDPSHGLSDITLAWMVQQISDNTDLEFDLRYLLASRKTFSPNQMNVPWGCEGWPSSYIGFYRLGGKKPRTPNKYLTPDQIRDGYVTNEYIHKSVFRRIEVFGKAYKHPDLDNLKEDEFGEIEEILSWY
jgi:hypothetical protein